jgi:Ca2+-binding RTX toxin-like protein
MADIASTLAEISSATYDADPTAGLPPGFTTVDLPDLGSQNGVFTNGHALAVTLQGVLDGQQVLVVAIRGTDSTQDWIADVTNINTEYDALRPLAAALEHYAAAGGKVVLTGHSMGGAMDQLFMAEHPGDDHYRAVTFGSPGALPQAGVFTAEADARITNYAISDDPFVYLGEHRGEIADAAQHSIAVALGLSTALASLTHLAPTSILQALHGLAGDYVNNGSTVTIAGAAPALSLSGLLQTSLSEHDPETYLALTRAAGLAEPSLWSGALTLQASAASPSITGGMGNDTLVGYAHADQLRGADGDDSILGGASFDDINGNKGEDSIDGGAGGSDWLLGGQGNDVITAHGGDNILAGNLGADTLHGGAEADTLRGGQGDDLIYAGAGPQWLSGDRGDDTLVGGSGADIYHSFSGAGLDLVTNFDASKGDRVQLDAGTVYSLRQMGADTVIDMSGGDSLVLKNTLLASLPAGWIFST